LSQIEKKFKNLLNKYQGLIAEQNRFINRVSNLRLAVFLVGAGWGIYLLTRKNYGLLGSDLVICLALFLYLIVKHEHCFKQRKYLLTLRQINEDALKRLQGEWTAFRDNGKEFADDSHPYSQDLDIFGQGSLFQLINTAVTYLGRHRLKDILLTSPGSFEEISARQEAVIDLAARLDWRQRLQAEEMAHPLIRSSVANDLQFAAPESILLITGSNMSGKSTLLRTAGINLVLAYAGTAVSAQKFACSLLDIYTCMRVSDNLGKNISSFYAELLRIKEIVKAAAEGRPVFFLLDEVFKGTNSIDRHTGARALIRKLNRKKALGLISTHDLELGDLAKESAKIKNYHFQEYYENDQICFDYKLRPGVSSTRNAAYLMKLAGIETV
jgi:DNA mismatch repair ATPase MutS